MTTFVSGHDGTHSVRTLALGSCTPFGSNPAIVRSLTTLPLADAAHLARLNTVLVYESLSAALWAAETIIGLTRGVPLRLQPHITSWSFAALENPINAAMATTASVRAKLIVLSSCSSSTSLPAAIERWLRNCLADGGTTIAAVAALFGRADSPDNLNISPRLQTVQRLAKEAGCDFFAAGVADGIGDRAST